MDGECSILYNNNKYSNSLSISLYIDKYSHLFNYVRIACFHYIDKNNGNNTNNLYYNFMNDDGIYLLDNWMLTTSTLELVVFIQQIIV